MRTFALGVCTAAVLVTACGSEPGSDGAGDAAGSEDANSNSVDAEGAESGGQSGHADSSDDGDEASSSTERDSSRADAAPETDAASADGNASEAGLGDGTLADAIAPDAGADAPSDAEGDAPLEPAVDAAVEAGPEDAGTDATCQSGTCSCNGNVVDLDTNPLDCGSCAHVCPGYVVGQTCAGGVCQPYEIASLTPPYASYEHLVSDGTYLYATSLNEDFAAFSLFEYAASTGKLVSSIELNGSASGLLTDGNNVYWFGLDSNNLGFIDFVANGQLEVLDPLSAFQGSSYLPVDGNIDPALGKLFFGTTPGPGAPTAMVMSVPLATAGVGPTALGSPVAWAESTEQPSMAADATQFYWTGARTSIGGKGLYAAPVGGGGSAKTLSSSSSIEGFRQSAGYVYFLDLAGGSLARVPTDGSTAPVPLAPIGGGVRNLALDAQNAYWIEGSATSSIKGVPLAGGNVTLVATVPNAGLLTVDEVAFYWVSGGAIMRLPK